MRDKIVITSAVRTPIGTLGGTLKEHPAWKLGGLVIKEAIEQSGIDKSDVNEVIFGNVLQSGQGMNPARQAALDAGLPVEIPAWTVNKVCGSGMKAVTLGAEAIYAGEADICVVGGMESMSSTPYILPKARFGYRMGHGSIKDGMISDGLWCSITDQHMGNTAENIATRYDISREEQDEFALISQQKAQKAIEQDWFKEEIVPVSIPKKKGESETFEVDEHPRPNVTLEKLQKMKPAFKADGTVTAGNASGINDGASALVIMSETKAKQLGAEPLAVLDGYASIGLEPNYMGLGPIKATEKLIKKTGISIEDIDIVEANEAFAVQSLAVMRELNLPAEKVNIGGGAIALGHPIGASGARIMITLINHLRREQKEIGLATLCIGGGMGMSVLLKKI